ncbi:uncharacterized protein LOC125652581 [Ostrea edulis]|uniref:uncharacterized protein LOC125652581 n=1 Tax=Ostrea edulis TaxID=37623 RepID=UPI0024AEA5DF|nr:uncharacterized protein LOC125652581 [Ostrea edulis]
MPKEKSTRAKKKKGGDVMRKGRTNKNVEGPVEFQEQTTMETSRNNGFEGEMDVSPRDEPSGFRMENSRETIREQQVWVVGSSIVKRAFLAARIRPDGVNLGLMDRLNVSIWWQGKGGMGWYEMYNKIKTLLKVADPPDYIILHCGGNNIGYTPIKQLIQDMKGTIDKIWKLLPNTKLVWSQILPRKNWYSSDSIEKMNNSAKRINSSVAAYIVRNGGCYIKYLDIKLVNTNLFEADGVHISNIGNEIFLNNISAGLEQFITNGWQVYPKLY